MGVDYKAVLVVGQEFESASEVVDFLRERLALSEEDEQEIEDRGNGVIQDLFCGGNEELYCTCLNAYSGYGWVVGYQLNVRDALAFAANTELAFLRWDTKFPGTVPDVIHAVKVY